MGIVICLLDIVYLIVRLCTFGTIPKVCNVLNFCDFDDPSGYQSDMHLFWHSFAFDMLFFERYRVFVFGTAKDFWVWEALFLKPPSPQDPIFEFGKLRSPSPQVLKTRFPGLGNFVR